MMLKELLHTSPSQQITTVSASNVIAFSVPHTHPQGPGKDSWIGKSLGVSKRLILEGREIVEKLKTSKMVK